MNVPLHWLMCFYHSWHLIFASNDFSVFFTKKNLPTSQTSLLFQCVFFFVLSFISISQVSVGTRQTWSIGVKHLAKTSSLRRSRRLSWSLCGRPYKTLHSSSWRLLPSSPLASLSTSLLERKANVRKGQKG